MIQYIHDNECLTPKLVEVHDGADELQLVNDQRYIVVCRKLRDDKKERYLLEHEEQQHSKSATFSDNRLAVFVRGCCNLARLR